MGTLVYDPCEPGPRACVFVSKKHHALRLSRFCSRDLAVASVRLRLGGGLTDLIVCSAYFPYDSAEHPPREELRAVVEHCRREVLDLVIGCDANSHHVAWGSSNTNKRGTALLEYLSSSNLEILNRGSRSTFVTSRRQKVIDLTLGTPRVARWLEEWRVDDEDSLSDHRRILFKLRTERAQLVVRTYRDPRATDWALYKRDLEGRLLGMGRGLRTEGLIVERVSLLSSSITQAFEAACPLRTRGDRTRVAWWSKELSSLLSSSRRLLNKALKSNGSEDWANYRNEQRAYKKLIKKSKREAWGKFCSEVQALSLVAKLRRVLANGPQPSLGGLSLPNGEQLGLVRRVQEPGD
ncbi:PREDICTED: uncharacterized protein LOC107072363 [Polistes dominula]|uniref:Uncharacterized protein LOC107072363 n=1 Tax=Polistes dominula TaxID=743375 RepID=A0ABM1J5I2_POLDO|nr:PREDICTED: uncharacterized protein LOC107072363 [Polistes dominula]